MTFAPRRTGSLLLVGVALVAASGSATALAAPLEFPETSLVLDLAEATGGNADVLVDTGRRIVRQRLGESGAVGAAVTLAAEDDVRGAALLPGGGALLVRADRREPRVVVAADVDAAGAPVTATRFRTAQRSIGLYSQVNGPGGAAVVQLLEQSGRRGRARMSIAYRAAAGAPFARAQTLQRFKPYRGRARDPDMSGTDTEYVLAVSPLGGGAVLSLPDTAKVGVASLRWISPAGRLGPKIGLGIGRRGQLRAALSFGPTGKLAVLIAARRPGRSGRGDLFVSTLAAGATAAPAPQRLMTLDEHAFDDEGLLALAASDGERVVALGSTGNGDASRTRVFESNGGAFAQVGTIPTIFPRGFVVLPQAGGGTTVVWQAQAQDDFLDEGAYVSTRPPGGAFSAPRRLTPPEQRNHFTELELARPLSGGRLAITYRDYFGNSGPVYAAIVRP